MPNKPRTLTHNGVTLPLAEWSARAGIPAETIRCRLDLLGWSVAEAVTVPPDRRFRGGGRRPADVPRPCPELRRFPDGRAYCRWTQGGRRRVRYFGRHGTRQAADAYAAFRRAWDGGPATPAPAGGLTVAGLIVRHTKYARSHYVKEGRITSEYHATRAALQYAVPLAARPAASFSPADLKACRQDMVGAGHTRKTCNSYTYRIVRMFGWAAGEGLVPATVVAALREVRGLQAGRTAAPDRPPRAAVPWEHVAATLPHLDRREARRAVLESLIRTHWLVGCRSSELLAMRPADLDRSADVWRYDVPRDARGHKNLHRTGRAGTYWVGPRCQKVLSTFLTDCPSDRPVFALPPLRKGAAWRTLDKDGYLRTIAKACKRAGVPHWSPHQLRRGRSCSACAGPSFFFPMPTIVAPTRSGTRVLGRLLDSIRLPREPV